MDDGMISWVLTSMCTLDSVSLVITAVTWLFDVRAYVCCDWFVVATFIVFMVMHDTRVIWCKGMVNEVDMRDLR